MRDARDSQRSKVYAAELTVYPLKQTIANDALQAWSDKVMDKRVVRSRWGARRPMVGLGRNRGVSYGGRITLGVSARNEWVMLHELAHELTANSFASHGPEFCGVYLFLVEAVMGKEEAVRLRAAFKVKRVRVNRAGIPEVQRVVPESRVIRLRAERKQKKEESVARVRRMLEQGVLTRADLRRLAA